MKIKGIFGLTAIDPNTDKEFIQPIPNAILVFLNINTNAAINIETNALGAYDGDLPVGEYSVRAYIKGKVQAIGYLRQGVTFNVTSSTPVGAFDEWTKIDFDAAGSDPLLEEWKKVLADLDEAKIATITEIDKATNDFKDASQSVGTGKFVKDSLVTPKMDKFVRYLSDVHLDTVTEIGFYSLASSRFMTVENGYPDYPFVGTVTVTVAQWATNVLLQELKQENVVFRRRFYFNDLEHSLNKVWVRSYNTHNTMVDKNNVIHATTNKPKNTLLDGDYGIGTNALITDVNLENYWGGLRSFQISTLSPDNPVVGTMRYASILSIGSVTSSYSTQIQTNMDAIRLRGKGSTKWTTILTDKNTVVDTNGNLKMASPVIQLHHDHIVANSDFDPLNPPTIVKQGTGEYLIKNCGKMRSDGWTFSKPMNGKGQYYFMLKWEQINDKDVLIRIFEVEYTNNGIDFGKPKDILENERWVDLHFDDNQEYLKRVEKEQEEEMERLIQEEQLEEERKAKEEAERIQKEKEEQERLDKEMEEEMINPI